MLMQSPKIIVIIVSYNGEKWIYECIRSIMNNSYDHYEIVVVDNASQDATASIIKENFREVILFKQKRNIGFGKGANVGIRYAMSQKADYILLLNQDIKLERNCIEYMIAVCDQNRKIGIASPLQMNYDGSQIDPHFRRLYNLKSDIKDANEDIIKGSLEVDTVIGASMLFRTTVIESIGGFDPLYFLYHEEGDLCRRAKYHGFQIHIIPKAIVYHKHIQLSPNEMTLRAKFASLYGYYFFLLKNPFASIRNNFSTLLENAVKWTLRDMRLNKIIPRFLLTCISMIPVLLYLHQLLQSRNKDMKGPHDSSGKIIAKKTAKG